jgi:hypothetical protein
MDLNEKFKNAFLTPGERAREEAVLELLDEVDQGVGNLEEAAPALVQGLGAEASHRVLSSIWGRLARMNESRSLVAFARDELESRDGERRSFGVHYLANVRPQDSEALFQKMSGDPDGSVLFEVGKAILPKDPRAAVETWYKAMDRAGQGLANEVLPSWIGQYADDAFVGVLRGAVQSNPRDDLAQLALWHADMWRMLEYLNASGPVASGSGYIFSCPNCKTYLAARDGHSGEEGRCLKCRHEFLIPERPENGGS